MFFLCMWLSSVFVEKCSITEHQDAHKVFDEISKNIGMEEELSLLPLCLLWWWWWWFSTVLPSHPFVCFVSRYVSNGCCFCYAFQAFDQLPSYCLRGSMCYEWLQVMGKWSLWGDSWALLVEFVCWSVHLIFIGRFMLKHFLIWNLTHLWIRCLVSCW